MATGRLPMRKIRDVLRRKWLLKRSHRETARSLGISVGVVGSVLARAKKLELTWAQVGQLGDDELEIRLYLPAPPPTRGWTRFLADPPHPR